MVYPHPSRSRLVLAVLLIGFAAASPNTTAAQQQPPSQPADDYFIYIPFAAKPADANAAPTITSFIATPATITPTGSSTLRWNVVGATSLSISGIGVVAGSNIVVSPITTTQYTLTASSTKGTTTAKATVTVTPVAPPTQNTFFAPYLWNDQIRQNVYPQIAVDAAGGVHVAYTDRFGGETIADGGVYYGYCPSACTSAQRFQTIKLVGAYYGAWLALDGNSHPRLLISEYAGGNPHYRYAECDTNCANTNQWHMTGQLGAGSYSQTDVEASHPFALDANGHPRFVFSRWTVNGTDATFLMSCDSNCTSDTNWAETTISEAWWENLNLALTPQGLPRIAYVAQGQNAQNETVDRIFYLECTTANCSSRVGPLVVQDFQGKGVYAMKLDSAGHPRMAINPGWDRVFYFVCDANCATDDQQWTYLDIGLLNELNGKLLEQGKLGVTLALDADNRPRIAFHSGYIGELGYAWCNTNCRDQVANWRYDIIGSRAAADQELGHIRLRCDNCVPKLPDCQSAWDVGYWPALALDARGNPRIAYESQLWTFAPGGLCRAQAIARVSRIAVFDQP